MSAIIFKRELLNYVNHFVHYRLIGDRVFYFEAFQTKRIALNAHTNSYFRKDGESISSLATKGMEYLDLYYNEHSKFAYEAYRDNKIDKILYQTYIKRFFNRVNNRLTKSQKLQVAYFKLRMRYNMDLKKPR